MSIEEYKEYKGKRPSEATLTCTVEPQLCFDPDLQREDKMVKNLI